MKLLHLGIPTQDKMADKSYVYVEKIKLHVTNPDAHEFKLQFVWAEPDSPLPEIVRKENHFAIQVDNIEEEIKKFDYVAFAPVAVTDKLKICFAVKDGTLFELSEVLNIQ